MNVAKEMVSQFLDVRYRRTTLIAVVCFCFGIGIILAPYSSISGSWLVLCVVFLPVVFKRKLQALLFCISCALIAGQLYGLSALAKEQPLTNLIGQKIEATAVVSEDAYYDSKKRLVSVVELRQVSYPTKLETNAPVRISTYSVSGLLRGDVIRLKGRLVTTLGNVSGAMYFADVEIIGRENSWANNFRLRFEAGLRNALPEPQASFAAGLLIGQRSGLPEIWQDILRDAGLTHIIAVSGYNLTILVVFIRRLLKKGSRYQILLMSSLLVAGFLAITGFSPSILRAAIVVALLQFGWFYGKQFRPIVLIALAIAISAAIDPFQLWRSVGWYLSFAAFFGIIVLAPLGNKNLEPTMSTSYKDDQNPLKSLILESLIALLMTAPIIIVIFGRFSAVSILANIVVAPFIPLAMATSFAAGIAGMYVPLLSGFVALPALVLLTAILDVANLVSRLPGSSIEVSIGWRVVAIFYLCIAASAGYVYKKRIKSQHLTKESRVKIRPEK